MKVSDVEVWRRSDLHAARWTGTMYKFGCLCILSPDSLNTQVSSLHAEQKWRVWASASLIVQAVTMNANIQYSISSLLSVTRRIKRSSCKYSLNIVMYCPLPRPFVAGEGQGGDGMASLILSDDRRLAKRM
eukprot:2923837-Pleurochrysis_carterae.AAC.1